MAERGCNCGVQVVKRVGGGCASGVLHDCCPLDILCELWMQTFGNGRLDCIAVLSLVNEMMEISCKTRNWYHQYCPGYVRYRMQPERIDSPTTKKILRKKPMLRTAGEVTAPLRAEADQGQPDAAGEAVVATPVGSQDPMFSPVGVVRVEAPVRGADQMLDQAARAGVAPGRMAPPMPRQQAGDRAAGGEVFTQQEFEEARAGRGNERGQGQKHAEWKIEAITKYWGVAREDAVRLLDGGLPEAKLMQFKRFVQAEEADQQRIEKAQRTERAVCVRWSCSSAGQ